MKKILLLCFICVSVAVSADPRLRPDSWGVAVIGTDFDNLYRVDKGLYRSEQPSESDVSHLKLLGIKEILNLRNYHSDADDINDSSIKLYRIKMNAGSVTEQQLIQTLKIIKDRKAPLLVHCWHGSDRTGTIAAYRVIFNNWSKKQAIDEMKNGGYGYYAFFYPGLVTLIEDLNVVKIKEN